MFRASQDTSKYADSFPQQKREFFPPITKLPEIRLNERCPRGTKYPALIIDLDALTAQQPALLVDGDTLAVLRPLALEATEGLVGGYDAVAWDLRRERVPS